MSLDTWKAKFYQIPADKCKKKDATAHSILKWSGLKKSELRKHGVTNYVYFISDEQGHELAIDGGACALCTFHWRSETDYRDKCFQCPGVIANGYPCDDAYGAYIETGKTATMMRWLKKIEKNHDKSCG